MLNTGLLKKLWDKYQCIKDLASSVLAGKHLVTVVTTNAFGANKTMLRVNRVLWSALLDYSVSQTMPSRVWFVDVSLVEVAARVQHNVTQILVPLVRAVYMTVSSATVAVSLAHWPRQDATEPCAKLGSQHFTPTTLETFPTATRADGVESVLFSNLEQSISDHLF